ncbi:MAG TPA: hypothetical protein VIU11_09445 [Nakamurella sp.]
MIDRAELLRGRAQPHADARSGPDRRGPRRDGPLPALAEIEREGNTGLDALRTRRAAARRSGR